VKCRSIPALLSPLLDGELTERLASRVGDHLGHCPACRAEEADLRALIGRLGREGTSSPAPDLWPAIQASLPSARPSAASAGRPHRSWQPLLARAAAVLAGALVALGAVESAGPVLKPAARDQDRFGAVLEEVAESLQNRTAFLPGNSPLPDTTEETMVAWLVTREEGGQ